MMPVLLLIIGLVALVGGAELIVRGASVLARYFGLSSLVIGLTIVALGTSAPEIAVAVMAALSQHPDTGLGNVIGSNVFNLLFVLGTAALISPLTIRRRLVRFDVPLLIGLSVLLLTFSLNTVISFGEGCLLVLLLFAYTVVAIRISKSEQGGDPGLASSVQSERTRQRSLRTAVAHTLFLLTGLVAVSFGSQWVVDGASVIAREIGLSELIIGLTIVAIGTSLPEVATTVVAVRRAEADVAAGNAIGSSIFNLLGVVGVMAIVTGSGVPIPWEAVTFDLPVMIVAAVLCLPLAFTAYTISRREGSVLLFAYGIYLAFLIGDALTGRSLRASYWTTVVFALPVLLIAATIFLRQMLSHRESIGEKRTR